MNAGVTAPDPPPVITVPKTFGQLLFVYRCQREEVCSTHRYKTRQERQRSKARSKGTSVRGKCR
jgi:hypothetical protein